jgi:DNA-binding CsgD family transcriptional regulator
MELVATGLSSKEIGLQLNISRKTVENHRAWVMERVGARNVAELVRMTIKILRATGRGDRIGLTDAGSPSLWRPP